MNIIQLLFAMAESAKMPDFDFTSKNVGDKVEIVAEPLLNYFIDVDTNQQLSIDNVKVTEDIVKLMTSQPMVVVANNLNKEFNCGHCDKTHQHDIIVYIPEIKRRYFTSTKDVKHIEI